MTRWDRFAAAALQGIFSGVPFSAEEITTADKETLKQVALLCADMATEMDLIAERREQKAREHYEKLRDPQTMSFEALNQNLQGTDPTPF